jgi:hypothetical protein
LKKTIFLAFLLFASQLFAQSPYYIFNVSIKQEQGTEKARFNFLHRVCPFSFTQMKGSVFENDTSGVDWSKFNYDTIKSAKCFEVTADNDTSLNYGNQWRVYEHVLYTRITNPAADTMEIIIPVKINSFVTYVSLKNIPFRKGKFVLNDNMVYMPDADESMYMHVQVSNDYKWDNR